MINKSFRTLATGNMSYRKGKDYRGGTGYCRIISFKLNQAALDQIQNMEIPSFAQKGDLADHDLLSLKFKHIFDKIHSKWECKAQKFYFEGIIKNYLPLQGLLVNLHKNEYIFGKIKDFELDEHGTLVCQNGDTFEGFMKRGKK
jgi:hypothetical protein